MGPVNPGSAASVDAIAVVYEQAYLRFLRVAVAMVDDVEQARDAVQETFARAIASRASFRGEGRLEAWLWGTLINVCRAHRRSTSRNGSAPLQELATRPDALAHDDDLRRAIRALPERQRAVLFLRHYADLNYEQIGHALGVRRGTVAATLHAAHAAIRKTIAEVPK
jgi:RNA polymerase sigma factor (sigma-70 family)